MVGLQVAAGMDDFTHGVAMLTPGDAFRARWTRYKTFFPQCRNYVQCSCVVSPSDL